MGRGFDQARGASPGGRGLLIPSSSTLQNTSSNEKTKQDAQSLPESPSSWSSSAKHFPNSLAL